LSDESVIASVRKNVVPVALNLYEIRKAKGSAGEFYQKVAKQTPSQYQGLYVVNADAKVLARRGAQPKQGSWARDTLAMLDEGIEAFGEVTPRKFRLVDPRPFRGVGVRDDGSIVLAVYTRPMVLGLDKRGLGQPAIDSIVLTKNERTSLTLSEADTDSAWQLPAQVARAFHRVLSPTSDANNLARRDEVTKAAIKGSVDRVRNGIAFLSFTGQIAGEHVWEFDPHKGKKIRAEVKLRGVGTAEAKSGKLLSITLVGDGTYRHHAPYDDPSKYGAVVEWRLK
jgi:hypothetical protein